MDKRLIGLSALVLLLAGVATFARFSVDTAGETALMLFSSGVATGVATGLLIMSLRD